jgi:hypothetical protein
VGIFDRFFAMFSGGPTLGLASAQVEASSSIIVSPAPGDASVPLERAFGPKYTSKIRNDDQRDGIRTPWVPTQPRWLPEEVDGAWLSAEQGNLRPIATLIEAMRGDGTVNGLMRTRTSMVRLPVKFEGDPYLTQELQGVAPTYTPEGLLIDKGISGAFEVMCPIPALIDLLFMGVMAGVAVAELVDDPETGIPVLTPRDLHWLRFDWSTREWIYYGGGDSYVVDPGNGRWVMFCPESGPMARPWKSGAWLPCALAFVTKIAAVYDRLRWQAQLADPLKYFETTNELSEPMRRHLEDFLENYWMRAPGIVLPSGAKAGVVEVDGKGFDVYQQAEQWGEAQIAKALSGGQNVTSEGTGQGFGDGDIFSEIAENIIQGTAASLSECITQQVIKPWARRKYPYRLKLNGGVPPQVSWDVRSPARRAQEAEVLGKMGDSITKANAPLKEQGYRVDAPAFYASQGFVIPIIPIRQEQAPTMPTGATPAQLLPGTMGSDATMDRAELLLPESSGIVEEEPLLQ